MTVAEDKAASIVVSTEQRQWSGQKLEPDERPGFGPAALLVGAIGGLLTGACMLAAAGYTSPEPIVQELQSVALSDVETAAQSLVAGQAVALVEEAKACRRPLASLVVQASGKAGGTVRFRSGTYVSPNIRLGQRPERVAVPFPAPVEAGRGQIFLDNGSDGADIFLTPGFRSGAGPSTSVINVRWNPKASC